MSLQYVSATDVSNYLVKDTLVDYLKFRDKNFSFSPSPPLLFSNNNHHQQSMDEFTKCVTKMGQDFEQRVVDDLRTLYTDLETVGTSITGVTCNKTLTLMKKGTRVCDRKN